MMLRHLEAQFLRFEERMEEGRRLKPGIDPLRGNWTDEDFETAVWPQRYHVKVATLSEADGIRFLCPQCFHTTRHSVVCWFEGKVPDDVKPGPGRWTPSGTGIEDLTFIPGVKIKAVSVALTGGCNWHGFVRDGKAE